MAKSDLEIWLEGVVRLLRTYPRESAVIGAIEVLLYAGKLHEHMGWPEIVQIAREVPIGSGRCDMVFIHADGSRTLLEAKALGRSRDIVTGIGQLFLYEASYTVPGMELRKVLAVPGYGDPEIARACLLAGVQYLTLGAVETRATRYEEILTRLRHASD